MAEFDLRTAGNVIRNQTSGGRVDHGTSGEGVLVMIEHSSPISGVDASFPYVATAGYDNRVIAWDAATGVSLAEVRHDHLANQCRFSASGKLLATSSSDYSARIWRMPDLRLVSVLVDHKDDVEMTAISPDERRVATASRDHLVRVFDIGGRLLHRMEGHEADVLSVEWTGGGHTLVSTSDDGTVRRWDADEGRLLQTIRLGDVETDTVAVVDDETLVLGNDEGRLVIVSDGEPRFEPAHDAGIKRLVFDPAQRILVSSSYDRTVRFWRTTDGAGRLEHVHTTSAPADVWLRSLAKLDESRWVFGTFGTTYAVYDRSTDQWDTERVAPTPGVNAVTVADGRTYTVGDAGTVRADGRVIAETGSCCNFLIRFGDRVLTGGQLGAVFDAESGRTLHQHRSPLNCAAAFTADGEERVVIGTYTGEGLVFRLAGDQLQHIGEVPLHDNAVKGVAVADDTLFSVCATAAVAFHRLPDLRELARVPAAHERICNGATALPGGRFASIARDLTLRLWNGKGDRLAVLTTPHENSIKCVAADRSGRLVGTGGYRGRIAVYDTEQDTWVFNERVAVAGISSICPTERPGEFVAGCYDGRTYPVRVQLHR
jgi:WD40 repeat protein